MLSKSRENRLFCTNFVKLNRVMEKKITYSLLSRINSPEDLRRLKLEELPELCRELRLDIIDELAENPGHFASSLGVVELTVALHYVFNTPDDRVV